MGAGSKGSLCIGGDGGLVAIDRIGLTEHSLMWRLQYGDSGDVAPFSFEDETTQLSVSANGRVMVICNRKGGLSIFRRHRKHTVVRVDAANDRGGIKFELEAAPAEMTLLEESFVQWPVQGNAFVESECFAGCDKRSAGTPFCCTIGVPAFAAANLSHPTALRILKQCEAVVAGSSDLFRWRSQCHDQLPSGY